ncbi:hypothetical protein [Coleofasciculus chthonoplastes]|uniref:hypothetical protein n=1 Tax=Coleofasciculus chthonoplastes TaxID=64178 RepID=UPI0032F515AA
MLYTDPDLQFSSNLPPNFIDVLAELTVNYSVYKAGFALSIDADELTQNKIYLAGKKWSIVEWESKFWRNRIEHNSL